MTQYLCLDDDSETSSDDTQVNYLYQVCEESSSSSSSSSTGKKRKASSLIIHFEYTYILGSKLWADPINILSRSCFHNMVPATFGGLNCAAGG